MPSGNTTTDALADSLPTFIMAARVVNEYEGVMNQLVDKVSLGEGIGLTWREISLEKLTAQTVTEQTILDNPQQIVDTPLSITPSVIGLQTVITDLVAARIAKVSYGKLGGLAQNAMMRKLDADGLVVLDGASVSLSGTGTTLVSGVIAAASSRITSNTTEAGPKPINCVLHGFQIKDLYDELVAPFGTYPISEGMSARVYAEGYKGRINDAAIFEDGNIAIVSSDAKGGVFSKMAIILVQGRAPRTETRREPQLGGGATSLFLYNEYAWGERSPANWLYEILSDAAVPTS